MGSVQGWWTGEGVVGKGYRGWQVVFEGGGKGYSKGGRVYKVGQGCG